MFQALYLEISVGGTIKTGALKYKSYLVISMDAKKRIQRKKSLIRLADQTSCRLSSHKLHQKNTSHLKLYVQTDTSLGIFAYV